MSFLPPNHLKFISEKYSEVIDYIKWKHPELEEGVVENIIEQMAVFEMNKIYAYWNYLVEKEYLSDEDKLKSFSPKFRKETAEKFIERLKLLENK